MSVAEPLPDTLVTILFTSSKANNSVGVALVLYATGLSKFTSMLITAPSPYVPLPTLKVALSTRDVLPSTDMSLWLESEPAAPGGGSSQS